MPMLWRALFTIKEVIRQEGLQFNVPELAYLYTLAFRNPLPRLLLLPKPTRRTIPIAEPRQVTTRAKSGSKRRKTFEPDSDLFDIEKRLQDALTEEFSRLKVHHEKRIAEYEETLTGIRSAAAAKDKTITKLEKDKRDLEEQLLHSEVGIHEAAMNAIDEANVFAAVDAGEARTSVVLKDAGEKMDGSAGCDGPTVGNEG
ncbi:hypothetical protein Hanom_Chr08g00735851 [Helianthus anomalus]